MDKKQSRIRRGKKTDAKIRSLRVPFIKIHRTPSHIYAQVFASNGADVVASASSLDETIRGAGVYGGNVVAAKMVGKLVAERAMKAGIKKAAFNRSGFRFQGRTKALADAAREAGMEI